MILYPTANYAQFFTTLGRPFFPEPRDLSLCGRKIKQTTLFSMLRIPHRGLGSTTTSSPDILSDFAFPFCRKSYREPRVKEEEFTKLKIRSSSRGTLRLTSIAYIQEYLPHDRDLRIILVNYEPILSYWRQRDPSNFRANLHQGATPQFLEIPVSRLLAENSCVSLQIQRCRLGPDSLRREMVRDRSRTWSMGGKALRHQRDGFEQILRENSSQATVDAPRELARFRCGSNQAASGA